MMEATMDTDTATATVMNMDKASLDPSPRDPSDAINTELIGR